MCFSRVFVFKPTEFSSQQQQQQYLRPYKPILFESVLYYMCLENSEININTHS